VSMLTIQSNSAAPSLEPAQPTCTDGLRDVMFQKMFQHEGSATQETTAKGAAGYKRSLFLGPADPASFQCQPGIAKHRRGIISG
jgi:hypothetical protein